uniref:Wall-associated receptor kinase galacturonan-binding domain-containing protein n=1 Tax=Salix viminalis TaxID=40686 RepID=A0A6N2L5M0_SALVM
MNSFDCGTIRGAGYPFSGPDRPGFCGYPGFELSCINQDQEITIMRSSYKLLSNTSLNPNLLSSASDHCTNGF